MLLWAIAASEGVGFYVVMLQEMQWGWFDAVRVFAGKMR